MALPVFYSCHCALIAAESNKMLMRVRSASVARPAMRTTAVARPVRMVAVRAEPVSASYLVEFQL
jgi:hypothetical protein